MARRCCTFILVGLGLLGIVLIVVGCGLIPFIKTKIVPIVEENVMLKNNSEAFKAWQSPPVPVFLDMYFFDVLNPAEIELGEKPVVAQRGPYVYRSPEKGLLNKRKMIRNFTNTKILNLTECAFLHYASLGLKEEIRQKVDIKFSADGTEIDYKEAIWYSFDAALSKGSEDDNITTLNLAVLAIADRVQYESALTQAFISRTLEAFGEKMFIRKSIRELMWGYTPDVFRKFQLLLPSVFYWILPDMKVGFYAGANSNGTAGAPLNSLTGVSNVKNLGNVNTWKGNSSLNFWTTKECNMINGTDGSQWHPFISRDEHLYIFVPDMCRSVYIEYEKDSTVSNSNIPVYQYKVPSKLLADAKTNPDNAGFCTPAGNCLKSGVMNVSVCRDNAPIVVSLPHFLDADEEYQNAIDGMKPDSELRTNIFVEPTTGFVVAARKMLQINFFVKSKLKAFRTSQNLPRDYIFPMFWADEHAQIDEEAAAMFKSMVLRPFMILDVVQYSFLILGAVLSFLILCLTVTNFTLRWRRKEEKQVSVSETPNSEDSLLSEA